MNIVATVEREVLHLLLIDDARDFAGSGVNSLTRGADDLHRFRNFADFEFEIDGESRVGSHTLTGDKRLLVTFRTGLDRISADR